MEFTEFMKVKDLFMQFKEEYRANKMPVFLYGKGQGLREYLMLMRKNDIPIEGVIDGSKMDEAHEMYMGIEVEMPQQVYTKYENAYIVISAPRHRKAIMENIRKNTRDRFSIRCFDATLDVVQNNSGGVRKAYYLENWEKIGWLYDALADDKSKKCLEQVLVGSASNDCDCYATIAETSQYFPDCVRERMGTEEIFLDVGAYTGDSIEDFLKAVNGEYGKIYAFEPDQTNLRILKENLSGVRVHCMPYGAGSTNETHFFYRDGQDANGSAKVVKTKEEANMRIKVVRLDDVISEKITYMKMDIEGMELEALKGAEELIRKYRPKLAICVYHKKEDLLDIPRYILNLNLGYQIFLRHYWECSGTDTVLFCCLG